MYEDVPTGRDTVQVCLVSGGMDSTVAAAVAVEEGPRIDVFVYLDTGTGLVENREFVEELADHLGVQLWTLRTHNDYEELVKENGFPGPTRHGIYYRTLKERQLDKLASITGGKTLVLWSGVRSAESSRRRKNVRPVSSDDRRTWVAPIHDWSKDDCRAYIEREGLPQNPLWNTLGRSGDCYCGCYGSPEEKIDLRAAGVGYHADWIESLERDVSENVDDETSVWAWGALSRSEYRAVRANKDDAQMPLCSNCAPDSMVGGDGR